MKQTTRSERQLALSAALESAREDFMLRIELFQAVAVENKAKFDAYVAAGFTADQAMQLLCAGR